jgi:hypothetical protein
MLIRKSMKSGPIRITLSRRGITESVGGKWWRLQAGGSSARYSLRIPGTGITVRGAPLVAPAQFPRSDRPGGPSLTVRPT